MTSSASVQAGNRAIPQLDTVISAESYVSEPADLWRENLPAAWRDKGPRIESGRPTRCCQATRAVASKPPGVRFSVYR